MFISVKTKMLVRQAMMMQKQIWETSLDNQYALNVKNVLHGHDNIDLLSVIIPAY